MFIVSAHVTLRGKAWIQGGGLSVNSTYAGYVTYVDTSKDSGPCLLDKHCLLCRMAVTDAQYTMRLAVPVYAFNAVSSRGPERTSSSCATNDTCETFERLYPFIRIFFILRTRCSVNIANGHTRRRHETNR